MKIDKIVVNYEEAEIQGKNLSNTELLNKICSDFEVKLGKSTQLSVVELVDNDGLPRITFIFNKGYTRGKTMCVICFHTHEGDKWSTEMSEPFFKNGDVWESWDFKNKKRGEEFYALIEGGMLWND